METPTEGLTPCCTLVAPSLRWDSPFKFSIRLTSGSRARCAAPSSLLPGALDAVCGRLFPSVHERQHFTAAAPGGVKEPIL
jgi:hypothetical protein